MAFGRLERTQGPQPMSEINMTPLVDVMLVLVALAPFQLAKSHGQARALFECCENSSRRSRAKPSRSASMLAMLRPSTL